MDSIFKKARQGIESVFGDEKHSHSHIGHVCDHLHPDGHTSNRFNSFAAPSSGEVKWYVDGCTYFWAVAEALERARESIYILDWWLSPELYLRRPPSLNERYRLDNMLKAAAERGVKVNIIVYKEVRAALTLDSAHTRTALEALHPNIRVFRHPDHLPTGYDLTSELGTTFNHLTNFDLARASGNAIKALYGTTGDIVLFWAHHEKLIVVDNKLGFVGGLDLCFGRWDTSSHPIADAHPTNLDNIIFPGQDYNNARIFDFNNVSNWNQNKLDRTKSSRMGWSDVALSLQGPIVSSLIDHFVDRWNFIFQEKYKNKNPGKYQAIQSHHMSTDGSLGSKADEYLDHVSHSLSRGMSKLMSFGQDEEDAPGGEASSEYSRIQVIRSCTQWSAGHSTEHSIANAYIHTIENARHFIYIENQFFITATSSSQHPVTNKIGCVIVDRILRAHEEGEPFKVWVVMPAVPAFAGDLESEGALGTRAIMEFQYNSISRGGHSIIETLQKRGVSNPGQYIGFYNLRSYDRINTGSGMARAEQRAGVSYERARKEHDDYVGAGRYPRGEESRGTGAYETYQRQAREVKDDTWDSVSSCYMNNGESLVNVPWHGDPEEEINAFVSEELYVHSKLLIADDRVVICGSANLNDRSQLGTNDSEIAVIIEGGPTVESFMNGEPYEVSRFATSLRRQIFRKHLGLLPHQPCDEPDTNWLPINHSPNEYDWGSPADGLVRDPLHPNFNNLWRGTARANTEIFSRAFHPVPNDHVRTWQDYKNFFSKYFIIPSGEKEGCKGNATDNSGKVEYGHIVREEFPGGVQEVKEWLGGIRGTLVDMPLDFLVDVDDIAKEGLALNSFVDELYT
ncbi:putative phospholipase D [Stachybotrys elegans]|uniref:Phospholipase n=1 Tax=Stachybotrys elegans TaxID=80388 RepID=A0A8K0T3H5_9HYPO|nr:putative phospholipase D [Stachybotrys elegans]